MWAIEEAGISTGWIGPTMFVCVVVAFMPIAIWRWRNSWQAVPPYAESPATDLADPEGTNSTNWDAITRNVGR